MSWGYVAIAAATAYSSYQAGEGADAQRDAANLSIEQKRRNFALIRKDTRLARMSGDKALLALNDMMGISNENPYDVKVKELQDKYDAITDAPLSTRKKGGFGYNIGTISGGFGGKKGRSERRAAARAREKQATLGKLGEELDPLKEKQRAFNEREKYDFKGTPGYQFRLSEGEQALERSQAGRRLSGRAIKETQRYGQGFASREFSAQFNRLSSIANRGQNATSISAGLAPNISNEAGQIGVAGANEARGQSDAVNTGANEAWLRYNKSATS